MGAPRLIIIHPYSNDWPARFAALAERLDAAVGDLAIRIDHIGSTAVPGLAAKDIIDAQITVARFDPLFEARMAAAGWPRRPDVTADHVPAGQPTDPAQWAKTYYQQPDRDQALDREQQPDRDQERLGDQALARGAPDHIHVRIAGRLNQRYPLLFRDYLCAHDDARDSYGLIKMALARKDPTDWEQYYDVKDPVCDLIAQAAERWAAATGWAP